MKGVFDKLGEEFCLEGYREAASWWFARGMVVWSLSVDSVFGWSQRAARVCWLSARALGIKRMYVGASIEKTVGRGTHSSLSSALSGGIICSFLNLRE